MKKKIIIAAAVLLLGGGGAGAYFFMIAPGSEEIMVAPVRGYTDPPDDGTEVTDPVMKKACKKTFWTESAVFEQKTYYFCCPVCPGQFLRAPEKYADED
jgi:YHS domain-containing protein